MKILCIGGQTATGKTEAAIAVAERFGAEIVSADAMQVYRGMDIGTAKPSPEELRAHPHHCVNIREPWEPYDATDFARDADAVIAQGRPVVVVGGTGFYFRALLTGFAVMPSADPALRAELGALEDPHAELQRVDPVTAARLHPNDRVRVIRALEVQRLSGQPMSAHHAAQDLSRARHPSVRVMLVRSDLDLRIDLRVLRMMAAGYLDEVAALLARGVSREAKPMRSLGYRWLAEHLLDGLPLADAVRLTQRDTRRFARKQRTMFRSVGGFVEQEGGDLDSLMRQAEIAFSG